MRRGSGCRDERLSFPYATAGPGLGDGHHPRLRHRRLRVPGGKGRPVPFAAGRFFAERACSRRAVGDCPPDCSGIAGLRLGGKAPLSDGIGPAAAAMRRNPLGRHGTPLGLAADIPIRGLRSRLARRDFPATRCPRVASRWTLPSAAAS